MTDLHQQIDAMRPGPCRASACLQLRNNTYTEDVVQETMLAVLENSYSFRWSFPSLRTYVIGILKFKLSICYAFLVVKCKLPTFAKMTNPRLT